MNIQAVSNFLVARCLNVCGLMFKCWHLNVCARGPMHISEYIKNIVSWNMCTLCGYPGLCNAEIYAKKMFKKMYKGCKQE